MHTLLEAHGQAPKLHGFEKVTNLYYGVVMEKITGKCVDDYLKKNPEKKESVMKQCRAILSELHGAASVMVTFVVQTFWFTIVGKFV